MALYTGWTCIVCGMLSVVWGAKDSRWGAMSVVVGVYTM